MSTPTVKKPVEGFAIHCVDPDGKDYLLLADSDLGESTVPFPSAELAQETLLGESGVTTPTELAEKLLVGRRVEIVRLSAEVEFAIEGTAEEL